MSISQTQQHGFPYSHLITNDEVLNDYIRKLHSEDGAIDHDRLKKFISDNDIKFNPFTDDPNCKQCKKRRRI